MGDRVMVPVQFRAKEATEQIEARESGIKHLPPGIDLLIGTKDQRRMKMKIDQGNDRLEIKRTRSGSQGGASRSIWRQQRQYGEE